VRKLDIDGDAQADLAGQGGEHRAVFVYQMDSYDYWESFLGRNDFTFGQSGENFTVDGLSPAQGNPGYSRRGNSRCSQVCLKVLRTKRLRQELEYRRARLKQHFSNSSRRPPSVRAVNSCVSSWSNIEISFSTTYVRGAEMAHREMRSSVVRLIVLLTVIGAATISVRGLTPPPPVR
jgi:hypothetical protein